MLTAQAGLLPPLLCMERVLLTLNPSAWLGTNICTEHSWHCPWDTWVLGTAGHCLGGHLGTWHSWALPVGCLGTPWGDTSRLPCLGNTVCHRARGSDGDSVAVPATVPGLLGHVGPNPAGAMCLGPCLRLCPAAPLPHTEVLPAAVSGDNGAASPGAAPMAAPVLGRNCKAIRVEQLSPAQPWS